MKLAPLPVLPQNLCTHLLEHGDRHGCNAGLARCEPAYVDASGATMPACPRFHSYAKARDPHRSSLPTVPAARPSPMQPCAFRGEPTSKLVACETCVGTQLKTFACSVFGECTIAKPGFGVAGLCAGCYRRQPEELKPERTIKLDMPSDPTREDGHGSHYNCSIIEWQGKTLLASRFGWNGSSVWLCELGPDYQPIAGTLRDLGITHAQAKRGVEDPRLFMFGGRLHIAVSGYDARQNGGTSLILARFDDCLNIEAVWIPQYEKRRNWEKNWAFFESAGALHSVYEIDQAGSHVVLRHDGDRATEAARTKHDYRWAGTAMRGGAPPVRVGGEMYHWFHSFTINRRGLVIYGLGLYTFAATSPFQIVRRLPGVVLLADAQIPAWSKSVLFPCGAILRDGQWVISYGQNDRECKLAFFDAREVEWRLNP